MLKGQFVGLLVGMLLGIVWMWLGFGAAVLTAFLGLIGWFIGGVVFGVVTGDVRIESLLDLFQSRR